MKKMALLAFAAILAIGQTGCKDDTDETLTQEQKDAATSALEGDMVVSAHASVNSVDKTLLDGGAPCMFHFEKTGDGRLTMSQDNFKIGNMPFGICFKIEVELKPLLSLESQVIGDGWIRIEGKRGRISVDGRMPDSAVDESVTGDGSTVTGYVNPATSKIQMSVTYAMSLVRLRVPEQAIDPSRVENFEAEKAKYEEDLEEYKKSHGLQ